MDCWEKRQKRGYLFMTGDEEPYPILSKHIVEGVIGDRLDDDLTVAEVVAELQKTFVPFFIIPDHARRARCERAWRDVLGDHVLCMEAPEDICHVTAGALLLSEGLAADIHSLDKVLEAAGMPANRSKAVLKTLTPVAEVKKKGGFFSFLRH
jgi:hypothetical protein